MKRWMAFGSLLAMTVFAAGCGKKISMDEAKSIALKDAGVASEEVTFTKEMQDEEEFELRFQSGEEIFEYEMSRSGKIESKSKEKDMTASSQKSQEAAVTKEPNSENKNVTENTPEITPAAGENGSEITAEPSADIGEEKAKAIALEKAGFTEDQVEALRVEKDRENGILVYEVEFYKDRIEYTCDVNMETGEIVKFEKDKED
ncbi:MAG: PepSY domain-containing protein [Clostridiales bacterium]|nr:PepSY domain-containing protein [Clostridiales bacterium]